MGTDDDGDAVATDIGVDPIDDLEEEGGESENEIEEDEEVVPPPPKAGFFGPWIFVLNQTRKHWEIDYGGYVALFFCDRQAPHHRCQPKKAF